jgi:hypothetical protein
MSRLPDTVSPLGDLTEGLRDELSRLHSHRGERVNDTRVGRLERLQHGRDSPQAGVLRADFQPA